MTVRKNDIVRILTGDQRGAQGRVLSVLREENRVLVEGVNHVWNHKRRSQDHPKGARIQKEAPIAISNVRVICQSCNKPARTRMRRTPEGKKVRICGKCGQGISTEG